MRVDAHATDGLDIPGDPQTMMITLILSSKAFIPSSKIGLQTDKTDIAPTSRQLIFEKQRLNQP